MRIPLLPLLLALTALAGCASEAPETDELTLADGTTVELGEGTSDTKGAIAGYVVDDAIRPVEGVELATDGRTALTDANGFFLLGDLEPGFYAITFTRTGFVPTQASADVVAGETATVKVQMPIEVVPQPYHTTYPFSGHMQAWGTIGQWAVELFAPTPLCDCTYEVVPDGNVTGIVFEAFWDATVPDPAALSEFYWEAYVPGTSWIQSGYCTDPCRADIPLDSTDSLDGTVTPFPQGSAFEVRISGPDAWVAYQQRVDVFTTVFYVAPPPEGWSIVDPA